VKLFARVLHPLLFKDGVSNKDEGLPDPDNDFGVDKFEGMAYRDTIIALKCLFALSTGRILTNNEIQSIVNDERDGNEQSLLHAVFVAKEMLHNVGSKKRKVSRFQRFLMDVLYSHASEGATMIGEVLSKYQVSPSTSYKKREDEGTCRKAVEQANEVGANNSKWHFYVFCKDNFDLKIKGPKPGNDAWVIMTRHAVNPPELKGVGFYQPGPTKRIS
jgi:hypothetical protein